MKTGKNQFITSSLILTIIFILIHFWYLWAWQLNAPVFFLSIPIYFGFFYLQKIIGKEINKFLLSFLKKKLLKKIVLYVVFLLQFILTFLILWIFIALTGLILVGWF
ncbi:hypothetical protein M0R19_00225 [Candidatus Pacearchaeota archaeon]|nr:hypothetical protein [Candidatus Pacearchaeota archaeon]